MDVIMRVLSGHFGVASLVTPTGKTPENTETGARGLVLALLQRLAASALHLP